MSGHRTWYEGYSPTKGVAVSPGRTEFHSKMILATDQGQPWFTASRLLAIELGDRVWDHLYDTRQVGVA